MIEKKLQSAADSLPIPRGNFPEVENAVNQMQTKPKSAPRKRLIAALVLVLLLVGCMSVTVPEYHLYNGNWWNFIPGDPTEEYGLHNDRTMKAAEELGITLPETLGGYPIIAFSRYNLTTREVPLCYAWIWPDYLYFSSYYGVEMEEPRISPEGNKSTYRWNAGTEVTYGPTDHEVWRRQFGFDESDVYTAGDYTLANHPVTEITSLEYEGITVYVGQIGISFRELPRWSVTWVDCENGVVFSLDGYYETPDDMIGFAKQIIDLNK